MYYEIDFADNGGGYRFQGDVLTSRLQRWNITNIKLENLSSYRY